VIEKVGAVAYKLQLPPTSKIHPVFHVSLLKRAVGNYHVQGELPKDLEINEETDVYQVKVVGSRVIMQGDTEVRQSLIQWKNKALEDVTWEDNEVLLGPFPEFCLEDKALVKEVGVDRNVISDMGFGANGPSPRVWKVYTRKKTKGRKNDDVVEMNACTASRVLLIAIAKKE
jgi:hypothetical protein